MGGTRKGAKFKRGEKSAKEKKNEGNEGCCSGDKRLRRRAI
jgi:hypothetical protein